MCANKWYLPFIHYLTLMFHELIDSRAAIKYGVECGLLLNFQVKFRVVSGCCGMDMWMLALVRPGVDH